MRKLLLILLILLLTINVVCGADNIKWHSYEEGIALSKETSKPILLLSYFPQSPPELVFKDNSVIDTLNNKYIPIKIDVSSQEGRDLIKKVKEKTFGIQEIYVPNRVVFHILNPDQKYLDIRMYNFENNINVNQTDLLKLLNQYSQTNKYDLGIVTIKEFRAFVANLERQKQVKINARLEGATIRTISTGNPYSLTIDDGSGPLDVIYQGGLGDINIGDQVDLDIVIEGTLWENREIYSISPKPGIIKITKSGNLDRASQNIQKSEDITTNSGNGNRAPGFSLIIGIFALLFIWRRIKIK